MTIEELCRRSYDTAVVKGWHEEPRSMGEVTALFHSEVSEALECWRDPARVLDEVWMSEGGKPEGFVIELADLLIRIGDTAVDMKLPLVRVLDNISVSMLGHGIERMDTGPTSLKTIPEWLAYIHVCLSRAFVYFVTDDDFAQIVDDNGENREDRVAFMLAKAMVTAGLICHDYGLDLEKALVLKMDYNNLRPHRHGGKRA